MAATLTADERQELLPFVEEKVDELLALTRGADAATVEQAVCLSLLRMGSDDLGVGLGDVFLDVLNGRGAQAAACLTAVAALGPFALARRAREMLPVAAAAPVPEGIGALELTDHAALRVPGATVYLLALERPGQRAWHAAHVIVEDHPQGAVIVVAAIAVAEAGGEIADSAATLAREPGAEIATVDRDGVRRAVDHAARLTAALRLPVGAETAACLPLVGAALGIPADVTCGLPIAGGASPLALEPDDDDGFLTLRDELLGRFERWLGDDPAATVAPFVADLMLGFKFSDSDGDLGRWTSEDIAELMLDYLPRKVDVDDELAAGLAPGILAFLDFLDDDGNLSGERLPALYAACVGLLEACLDRARDPAAWGPAKRLSAEMVSDGVDLGDEEAVQSWVAAFNARPVRDRDAVLGPIHPLPRQPRDRTGAMSRKKAKRRSARAARRRNR